MGWSNMEEEKAKKEGMSTSSKILLAIIACIVLIIILITILLINLKVTTFNLSIDEKIIEDYNVDNLISKVNNTTYIQIENFSKLVGYEYHKGEYKAFTIAEDKCYVQGTEETATFFLNDSKVCKLPINELTSDYREFTVENTVKEIDGKMYAPIEAIELAFNVMIEEEEKSLSVYTLDHLIKLYNSRVISWGYTDITSQNLENKKALLYGYLIVKKENGLYKIIDAENQNGIVLDKYSSIQFTENTKEFFVTNSLEQVGIINLNGTTKIEPVYDSISVLNKEYDLYLVEKENKYGVVKSGNITIIYPEYDKIGMNVEKFTSNVGSQYLILDTLIPVSKDGKWGAFDIEGNLIYKLEYDELGCNISTVKINEKNKEVEPVLVIKECNGVVVKQGEKYGLVDVTGKILVPIAVDSIYSTKNSITEEMEYFMFYNNEEINIIDRLIEVGLIKGENDTEVNNTVVETKNNNVTNNTITATIE